jgi:hypothetical protein
VSNAIIQMTSFFLININIDYSLPFDCDKANAIIPWALLKMPECSSLFSDCSALSTFTILDPLQMSMNDVHSLYSMIIKSQHNHRPPFKFRANPASESSLANSDERGSEILEIPDPVPSPSPITTDPPMSPAIVPDFSPPTVGISNHPTPLGTLTSPSPIATAADLDQPADHAHPQVLHSVNAVNTQSGTPAPLTSPSPIATAADLDRRADHTSQAVNVVNTTKSAKGKKKHVGQSRKRKMVELEDTGVATRPAAKKQKTAVPERGPSAR